ncbi:MAG: carbonic anhydrase [Actinomycetota bacterium]|nr:carbonic anhydrase [Actinomycetota bacterium]
MTIAEELLAANAEYAASFDSGALTKEPARHVAVVACMDARLDVFAMLGLDLGECHVIRNAGGAVTDDAIRSITVSQRFLNTTEIVLVHHTDCGMLTFPEERVKQEIQAETGVRPAFSFDGFSDAEADVRQSMARIEHSPFLLHRSVTGFVYDVDTGRLNLVEP